MTSTVQCSELAVYIFTLPPPDLIPSDVLLTGHDVFAAGHTMGSIKVSLASMDEASRYHYQMGVFHLLVYVPIVCAVLQLLAWAKFSLHSKRLEWVKAARSGALFSAV